MFLKKLVGLAAIILIAPSCSRDEDFLSAELDTPTAMEVVCQSSSNDLPKRVDYEYHNGNLLTERTSYIGGVISETNFTYNFDNQLIVEVYETDRQKTEKTFVYNELDQLVNTKYKFIDYDDNGQVISESEGEAPREYENSLLVKEWQYWGGFSIYKYRNGKVDTRVQHTKIGEEHHITTYTYSSNLLVRENKKTKDGILIYAKSYSYDSQKRLVRVHEGENIIEENLYRRNQLIERRTYYFGGDPGYDICYGNYIYRFEY